MTITLDRPALTIRICPDGLPWCVDHSVDDDGYVWHSTDTEVIRADRDGHLDGREDAAIEVRAVLVNNVDGTPDPVIYISEPLRPTVFLAEGAGLSPARAREMAALLVRFADHVEGGEHA